MDRAVGEPDGFGRYGVLEVTSGGLLTCAGCGGLFRHLGLHVYRAHGLTAAGYRDQHGLARGRGLVAADLHRVMADKARARMDTPAGERFTAARDPAAASAARIAGWAGFAPQVLAQLRQHNPNRGRPVQQVEVELNCELCGSRFCPLSGKRRRFCSRSCATTVTAANRTGKTLPSRPG